MSIALTFLILAAPFALAAALTWAAHRTGVLRLHRDQFRIAAPLAGRLFSDDRDLTRIAHDADAVRTRFERNPSWPSSTATGERR
ncbi:hypothetical protein GR927_10060 [Mycolicibacterium sp. 3033]|nr:hypothetical protein [Mycolicibacterium aurantiacum]